MKLRGGFCHVLFLPPIEWYTSVSNDRRPARRPLSYSVSARRRRGWGEVFIAEDTRRYFQWIVKGHSVRQKGTGCPSRSSGSYRHCRTASVMAVSKAGDGGVNAISRIGHTRATVPEASTKIGPSSMPRPVVPEAGRGSSANPRKFLWRAQRTSKRLPASGRPAPRPRVRTRRDERRSSRRLCDPTLNGVRRAECQPRRDGDDDSERRPLGSHVVFRHRISAVLAIRSSGAWPTTEVCNSDEPASHSGRLHEQASGWDSSTVIRRMRWW